MKKQQKPQSKLKIKKSKVHSTIQNLAGEFNECFELMRDMIDDTGLNIKTKYQENVDSIEKRVRELLQPVGINLDKAKPCKITHINHKIYHLATEYLNFYELIRKIISNFDEAEQERVYAPFKPTIIALVDYFLSEGIQTIETENFNIKILTKQYIPSQDISMKYTNIAELAVVCWKLQHQLGAIFNSVEPEKRKKYQSQYTWFVKEVATFLAHERIDYSILKEGQPYDVGLPIRALNLSDFKQDDALIISQILEPIIMQNGKLLKQGTVMLQKEEK
jgi:hypothetical protein